MKPKSEVDVLMEEMFGKKDLLEEDKTESNETDDAKVTYGVAL